MYICMYISRNPCKNIINYVLQINLLFVTSFNVKLHVACGSTLFHAILHCGASELLA